MRLPSRYRQPPPGITRARASEGGISPRFSHCRRPESYWEFECHVDGDEEGRTRGGEERTTTTPASTRESTAAFNDAEKEPPSDMVTTAGDTKLVSIQSSEAMMPLVEPLPEQLNTRIPTTDAPLAAPYDRPATVPATCVPCLR